MKKQFNLLHALYEILFSAPLILILTIFTAVTTMIVSPFAKGRKWGYYPAIFWARAICVLSLVRVEIVGKHLYDRQKSYIFVANHQSIYDVFPIYGYIGSRFVWIMKKELQHTPFIGRACAAAGHIFIDRSSAVKAQHSLDIAKEKLTDGLSVVIFAEGHRTQTGELGRFKRGAFSLAADLHLPIVPITINGAFDVLQPNSFWVHPGKIQLVFHEPIDTQDVTHENLSEIMEKTRSIVAADLKN